MVESARMYMVYACHVDMRPSFARIPFCAEACAWAVGIQEISCVWPGCWLEASGSTGRRIAIIRKNMLGRIPYRTIRQPVTAPTT